MISIGIIGGIIFFCLDIEGWASFLVERLVKQAQFIRSLSATSLDYQIVGADTASRDCAPLARGQSTQQLCAGAPGCRSTHDRWRRWRR